MKKSNIIFEEYIKSSSQSSIIYMLNGIMLEPKDMLKKYTILPNTSIYLVHYQRANTLEELLEKFLIHINTNSNIKSTIVLVGFSAGALVLHRLILLIETLKPSLKVSITSISIAPSHIKNYNYLKKFPIDYLDNLSEKTGYKILKRMPWFVHTSSMPFKEIIKQLKLFSVDEIYNKPLGVVDLILIPREDKLCFDYSTALKYSKNVLEVEGKHNISTLPLTSVINSFLL
jgi:hypothetical protein